MRFFDVRAVMLLACLVMTAGMPAAERDQSPAEAAAWALARPLEREGFEFRAEAWERDLRADLGKALRMQLFKGNDYRFCVAVPARSGVRIAATVLDFEGKPAGTMAVLEEGWGLVLSFKPKATGVYVIAVRQAEGGTGKTAACAVLTGYK